MLDFFHNFSPERILFSVGVVDVFWYGLFMVIAIFSGIYITARVGKRYGMSQEVVTDLAFYLVVFGIIGARVYDVFLELPYYAKNPIDVFKIWQGGLAIHGGLIGGALALVFYCQKNGLNFVKMTAILVPGLAFGQAIGRWGNYFNQELFGLPTSKPWGIFIESINRPVEYLDILYFHPTFLYESLGSLVIFGVLIFLHKRIESEDSALSNGGFVNIVALYLVMYSTLRFLLEYIRIDYAPTLLEMRWPQIISIAVLIASAVLLRFKKR